MLWVTWTYHVLQCTGFCSALLYCCCQRSWREKNKNNGRIKWWAAFNQAWAAGKKLEAGERGAAMPPASKSIHLSSQNQHTDTHADTIEWVCAAGGWSAVETEASSCYITSKNRDSALHLAVEQVLLIRISPEPLLERLLVVDLGW